MTDAGRLDSNRRPTAQDVARRAGVSRTTVSFVLNDRTERHGISPATARHVRAAAEELGYVPHLAAQNLRTGRSNLVIFLTPLGTELGTLALSMLTSLTARLSPLGLDLVIRKAGVEPELTPIWRDLRPVAVIGIELKDDDIDAMRRDGVVPVTIDAAVIDSDAGALQAQYLINRGHIDLAFVAPRDPQYATYARRRYDGMCRVCEVNGLRAPQYIEIDLEVAEAASMLDRLRRLHPGITALGVYNDELAFAVLAALARLEVRVPAEIAVIGIDNITLSAFSTPPLTTIDLDEDAFVAQVLSRLDGLGSAEPAQLQTSAQVPRVIDRKSV